MNKEGFQHLPKLVGLPIETETAELDMFIGQLIRTTGELLVLPGKKSPLGETYFLTSRYGQNERYPEAEFLLIDVAVQRQGQLLLVGKRDWAVTNSRAQGDYDRHGALEPTSEFQQVQTGRHWQDDYGIAITDQTFEDLLQDASPEFLAYLQDDRFTHLRNVAEKHLYRQQGLGSLMTAVSLLILHDKGVEIIDSTQVSKGAVKMWKKFGRGTRRGYSEPDPYGFGGDEVTLSSIRKVADLVKHPYVKEILKTFLGLS